MVKRFLDKAYSVDEQNQVRDLYDDWAASYDSEITENGYATPTRCAEALRGLGPSPNLPVLDFGCGTGLSGIALRAAGFCVVDGIDISSEMIAIAMRKGCYRQLEIIDESKKFQVTPGDYAAICAAGVFGPGHAPAIMIAELAASLGEGGILVLSLNDETIKTGTFEEQIQILADSGTAQIVLREYGDHLPARNIGSVVYALQKK